MKEGFFLNLSIPRFVKSNMSKGFKSVFSLGFALFGLSFFFTASSMAQTNYFTWNNSTNTWSTAAAWNPTGGPQLGTATANTNVAVFASVGTGNNTVLLGSDRTVYGLLFTNGANAYTFGSVSTPKALDIMSNMGLVNNSSANQIFNLTVNNNGNATWSTAAGATTTFNTALNLTTASSTASRTLTLAGAGNWNVATTIGNGGTATAGAVIVTGTGTTTFSGNNTYDGLTTMNAAGGTLTLSGNNSGATGGVTLTAGTLNINNNNALGSGALNFAGTNSAGVGPTINNTSGSAVVNAGNQAWALSDGLAFGSATNTSANNLNLGTGVVTVAGNRTVSLAGTDTKLTIGGANITSTSSGRTITANGAGNTLEMGGLTLSGNTSNAVTVILAGTANIGVTGAIVNGQAFANGVNVTATGTTTFSGNNTYTGGTTISAGTLVLSGANSSSGYTMAGSVDNILPVLRVSATNAFSTSATLSGASSSIKTGTLEFAMAGNYALNQYLGSNMNFSNSSGSASTLTFTNGNNILTDSGGTSGGRSLLNKSADLNVIFDGNMDIGSSAANDVTLGGEGNFLVKGSLLSSGTGVRGLVKNGTGTLSLQGSGNNYTGKTSVDKGTLSLSGALTGSTNLTVSTTNTIGAASTTRAATATLDVKSGATLLNNSTTTVYSGGNLIVNGTAGDVVLESNGLLGGSGTVGATTLKSGSLLNPGNSPGTLTAASATVLGGSTYNWQISALQGTGGTDWDLLSVTGLLDMNGVTSSNQWNLVITADSGFTGWTDSNSYSYVFAKAVGVSGFSTEVGTDITDLFRITASGIASLPNASSDPASEFRVVVGRDIDQITLNLTTVSVPEPSTGSLMMFALGGLLLNRLLRRKVS